MKLRKSNPPASAIMAAQLPPLQQPIAIFPQFIARQCESIKLREKLMSLSGDSFYIELYPANQPLLQVKGEAFSLSGRKAVADMQGNPLFTIRKQHFSIPSTYVSDNLMSHKLVCSALLTVPRSTPKTPKAPNSSKSKANGRLDPAKPSVSSPIRTSRRARLEKAGWP